ncbi:protein LURP-one-related 8-like [Triticum urartu]|uniref:protein LURP-one-related 8-like n=1 Tax=Triticum urartu TaxID=4572 RepID=UPI002043DD58|nr:protein LURP-one-related 8-like [Triticum urartu]
MAKVHPNLAVPSLGMAAAAAAEPVTLTVWRKSLLFNCRGFTVFDASGNLVYRVDIYASDSRAEVVLMDAAGRPVLTVRRKKAISLMGDQWLVFPGEARWTRCSGGRGCSGAGPRSAAETGSPPSVCLLRFPTLFGPESRTAPMCPPSLSLFFVSFLETFSLIYMKVYVHRNPS